jgi:hypothetical protein
MANITRNFVAGKMNKVVDERLVPNGEYIDALNIRMGSTENAEIGVIENAKGNTQLTTLVYPPTGEPLSNMAKAIGTLQDGANETIYWLVNDPAFTSSPTGKLDMIVSFNELAGVLTYHVVSTDDGGGQNTTLNFNPQYLFTGISLVDDMLFFTDKYEDPRMINVRTSYPLPVSFIDQITRESLLVIKKPPLESPFIQPFIVGGQENFLEERYICFAYRYRYADNQYSAVSQFSIPAFVPNFFEFSENSFLNEGMVNSCNSVKVTYNSGGPLVIGVDLLFKEANSNIIKVIEKLNKQDLGLLDNTDYVYQFTNSKIFTILPESEILRLYDNVPRKAKAQTIMGNRLMYSNYIEGYNLVDINGIALSLTFIAELMTEEVGLTEVPASTESGNYTFGAITSVAGSVMTVDLAGIDLQEGSALSIDFTFRHNSFQGDLPFPSEVTDDISITFLFTLPVAYNSVYEMASSVEFQNAVGTLFNIEPVYSPIIGDPTSCDGVTFTDVLNCAIPNNLDTLTKFSSGISAAQEPMAIIATPASTQIKIQLPAMRYVDDTTTPTQSVYEYYEVSEIEAFHQNIASPRSLHSNRGYEIGIVYMDDFKRSSTALVSPNNTVFVPCGYSSSRNYINVTIPVSQVAPYWATRYKFVIKPDRENYETIYSSIFIKDPLTNDTYFLIDGENSRKVEAGDRLIVKTDADGPTTNCNYATVLEKKAQVQDFLGSGIPSPQGVYMKINANNFSTVQDDLAIIDQGPRSATAADESFPIAKYPMNIPDTSIPGTWIDYDVPAGSRIVMEMEWSRKGPGDGDRNCEKRKYVLNKNFVSSADYANMNDWWDQSITNAILNDGAPDIGGGGCPVTNTYIPTLASSLFDIPTDLCTNYFRFYRDGPTNALFLLVTGTRACGNNDRRVSKVKVRFTVYRADKTLIFETEPQDALPDIFYESDQSFSIDAIGQHSGNLQSQDFLTSQPAIVETSFYNCYTFGNGAESYKIRDSIIGNTFALGNRVTSVSAEDYKEADRYADITYSGVYNDETNVNKLNEFNLGLINYKPLEDSFGQVMLIDGRETDVLVLQEDKISYVLAGKNLLSDAAAGGAITSVPEVLGTQIARVENYGISLNPESYVQWGYDRFFTDAKRGAVIQLVGNSYSSDQIKVISDQGMRTWFRDLFNDSLQTQKLGGFDPYMNEYVLSSNDILIPTQAECIDCGTVQTFTLGDGSFVSFCSNLGQLVGTYEVTYNVISLEVDATFVVESTYNGTTESSGVVNSSGSIVIDKDDILIGTCNTTINSTGNIILEVKVRCVSAAQKTIVEVCVTSDSDSGSTIHNEYRYTYGGYTSPYQSSLVLFASGSTIPLVSRYNQATGFVGSTSTPPDGATMRIVVNKIGTDTFNFDPSQDVLRYLNSNTLYDNLTPDILDLLQDSLLAAPIIAVGANFFYADVPVSSEYYLYLIWDYRQSTPITLCYSSEAAADACCECVECVSVCSLYYIDAVTEEAEVSYRDCSGSFQSITVFAGNSVSICSEITPTLTSGTADITLAACDCPS